MQEGKIKTFEVLKVARVKDSSETIKGKEDKLYDIYFKNGWQYDKQTTKPEICEMKINEYLIALSPMEIQEFDFFCRIYHEDLGAVFIPNRIKYESENLSLVELIKIG